jgi:hypothetical protein
MGILSYPPDDDVTRWVTWYGGSHNNVCVTRM